MSSTTFGSLLARPLLATLLAALVVAVPVSASAHAALVSSNPEDGAVLDTAPEQVELSFNEEMNRPSHVSVTAPDGTLIAEGEATVDGKSLIQPIPDADQAGPYVVAYRAISTDGHPITGELTFEVTAGKEVEPAAENVAASDDSDDSGGLTTPLVVALVAVPAAVFALLWLRKRRQESA